jgi:O-acetyl-ADP-ribose deacetylase (regulator of RNase III)
MEDNFDKFVDYRYVDKKCFAIMPFGIKPVNRKMFDFNYVYHELIEKAVTELGLNCERCDEVNITGSIHKTMFRKIFDADVAVVDITSQNPNVFYELGVRHALHKCVTIVICKSSNLQKIPFNINGLKIIGYEVDKPKQLEEARKKIREHIEEGLSGKMTDSLVHDNLEDLKVEKTPRAIINTKYYLYEIIKAPGKKIGIITGDIQYVRKVDVWVNSENTNMQMSRYFERSISGTIRYLGAKKNEARRITEDVIANELHAKVGSLGAVDAGAVIATGAGDLTKTHNVKKIFHAASVQGQVGRGFHPIPDIHVCIRSALELVDSPEMADTEIQSILFPLMGTGQSGLSAQTVTDRLIDTAIAYLEQCEESRIKEVYFLAYSEQDLELCKHKFIYDSRIKTPEGTL